MTEVSNLHRLNNRHPPQIPTSVGLHHEEEREPAEEEFHHPNPLVFINFDSFSPPINPSTIPFLEDYTTSFDLGFDDDMGFNYEDPNCVFYGCEEDDEQMKFVTDLFGSREIDLLDDPLCALNLGRSEDLSIESGFGPGLGGLRVTGMDSESDSEEFDVNSGFISNDVDVDDDENNYDNLSAGSTISYHVGENEMEDLEWEEVSDRLHYHERETFNSLFDCIDELSILSNVSQSEADDMGFGEDEGAEEEENIEWQVLLAMNNFERNMEFENTNDSEIPHIDLPEDYILSMEYDTLFGQLVENDSAVKGSPPAAKSVVENLASVVLTKEEVGENNSPFLCAVCKDEVAVGEKVTKMPCCHLYHGECILPWLKIRNTCPICRHELPTDDANYEKRRNGRDGSEIASPLVDDFVRYNFELLP